MLLPSCPYVSYGRRDILQNSHDTCHGDALTKFPRFPSRAASPRVGFRRIRNFEASRKVRLGRVAFFRRAGGRPGGVACRRFRAPAKKSPQQAAAHHKLSARAPLSRVLFGEMGSQGAGKGEWCFVDFALPRKEVAAARDNLPRDECKSAS